jgi:hypothetical protein
MKGILTKKSNYFFLFSFIILSIFLSACSGVTPTQPVVNSFMADTYILEEGAPF